MVEGEFPKRLQLPRILERRRAPAAFQLEATHGEGASEVEAYDSPANEADMRGHRGDKTNTDGGKTCLTQTIEVECERVRRKTESLGDRTGPHSVRTDLDKQPKHNKRFSYARAAKATNSDAFFIIRRI